jgi:DUF1680 family protein
VVNGYAEIRRSWSKGDTIDLTLPLDIQRLEANPQVGYDHGKIALRRGPLIYCLEQVDQEAPVEQISLPPEAKLESQYAPGLLGGLAVIRGQGLFRPLDDWKDVLYQPLHATAAKPVPITAVPYCIWGNRGPGKMAVWLNTTP